MIIPLQANEFPSFTFLPAKSHEHEQLIGKRATSPATGRVKTQAMTMLWATPQRTADSRLLVPTPKMLPEMTWVVLTGMPKGRV